MFYDAQRQVFLTTVPGSAFNSAGVLVSGLDLLDAETQADCGYFTVRSDSPPQPTGTVEVVDARQLTFDGPYVDVVRTWLAETPHVPHSVSARQIRLWLIDNNISLQAVETAIAAIEDPVLRAKTQVEWEYAPYIERAHPMLTAIGATLNFSDEQIDAAFTQAAQL